MQTHGIITPGVKQGLEEETYLYVVLLGARHVIYYLVFIEPL